MEIVSLEDDEPPPSMQQQVNPEAHPSKAFFDQWKSTLKISNVMTAIKYTDQKAQEYLRRSGAQDSNIDADEVSLSHVVHSVPGQVVLEGPTARDGEDHGDDLLNQQ